MPNQHSFSFNLYRLRPKGRGRAVVLKGAALLLLFIFAIQLSQQYWTFVLLGAGILMSWWGLSAYRHKRWRQQEMLCEIREMGKEKFTQYATDLLQSQGYQVHTG